MAVLTPEYVKLIGCFPPDATLWDAETTLIARDRYPSAPSPDGTTSSVIAASGVYEGTPGMVFVRIDRGGLPDRSARYTWSVDEGTTWYGWDPPLREVHYEPLDSYSGTARRNARMSMREAFDGNLLCVVSTDPDATGALISVYKREPAGSWAFATYVASGNSIDTTAFYPSGWGPLAELAVDADGAMLLAIQKHRKYNDGTAKVNTQVDIYRAATDADWGSSPFTLHAEDALETPLTLVASGDGPQRQAFIIAPGKAMILMQDAANWYQYAGPSVGSLDLVDTWAGAATCTRAIWAQGYCIIAYRDDTTGHLYIKRIADLLEPLSGIAPIDIGSIDVDATSGIALWVDEDLTVYVGCANSSGDWAFKQSRDLGLTWSTREVNVWGAAFGADINELAACAWRGRAVIAAQTRSATGYVQSAVSIDLGGWTTLPLPPEAGQLGDPGWYGGKIVPHAYWLAMAAPGASSGAVTITTAATVTTSWESDLRYKVVTDATGTWKINHAGAPAGTVTHWALVPRCEVTSGSIGHHIATSTYHAQIIQTSAGWQLWDMVSVAQLDSGSNTGSLEFLLWVDDDTGDVRLWVRTRSAATVDAMAYTLAFDGTLTSGAPTPGVYSYQGNSATTKWIGWSEYATQSYLDFLPEMTYGRPMSSLPTTATNGVAFAMRRGPARGGEVWTCAADSLYAASYAAATATYPSPRMRFETADATAGYIAWQLADDDTARAPVWLAWVETNAETVRLDWHDGSGWVTGPTIKGAISITGNATGRSFFGDSTLSASSRVTYADEFAGGWARIGGASYTIARHTSGLVQAIDTMGTQARFELTGDVSAPVTGGTIKLIAPRTCAVVSLEAALSSPGIKTAKGFRLHLSGDTPPDGRFTLKACIAPAIVLGRSHGRDTRRRVTVAGEDFAMRNGLRLRQRVAPTVEEIELSWQDAPDRTVRQARGNITATPDRINDVDGNPIYLAGSTHEDIRALVSDAAAYGRPVVYFPSWQISSETGYLPDRGLGAVLVTLGDTWEWEHAGLGEEYRRDVIRGGSLIGTEIK